MKSLLPLTLLFLSFPSFAQIISYPLEGNAVLQEHARQEAQAFQHRFPIYAQPPAQAREVSCLDFNSETNFYTQSQTVFVEPDSQLQICLDTANLLTFECLTCDELDFGSAEVNRPCLLYNSDAITGAGVDIVVIQRCDDEGFCIDLTFDIVVARRGMRVTEPPLIIQPSSELEICATQLDLPGEIEITAVLECNSPEFGEVRNGDFTDACILLTSGRFAQKEDVCLEVCDEFCVCDTVVWPIQALGDTLAIPFFDDFSYEGPYPNGQLWLDDNVFVNNTLAHQPPSIGVATFDGLNRAGVAYRGGYGVSDALTSAYLDLSSAGDNLVFSCFVQPKGVGYYPNAGDSLMLQFKNIDGIWERMNTWNGFPSTIPLDSLPSFEFYSKEITGSDFRYKGFQFRFVNFSNRRGIDDLWHVDYVILDDNYIPDGSFNDVAFTAHPNEVLSRYSAMPYAHFVANAGAELSDQVTSGVRNLFDFSVSPSDSEVQYLDLITGAPLNVGNEFTVFDAPTFQADEFQAIDRTIPGVALSILQNNLAGIGGTTAVVQTEAFFTLDIQANNAFVNDTIRRITYLTDYFSYDDGTAERALSTALPGQRVAVKFESTISDTLRGVQLNLPPFTTTDMALFDIQVYLGELDEEPEYEEAFLRPFYPGNLYDTIQALVTYRLNDIEGNPIGLEIPAGDFYIAIEQASTQPTPIGFDINSTKGQANQFVYNQIEWFPLPDEGNVMIRALFSSQTPVSTDAKEETPFTSKVQIAPNPVDQRLYFSWEDESASEAQVSLFSVTGQLIRTVPMSREWDVSAVIPGFYLLVIQWPDGRQQVERIVVQ